MIAMSLENFYKHIFEDDRLLKPTIDNQLDRIIIVVNLAPTSILKFDSMACGYHQYPGLL